MIAFRAALTLVIVAAASPAFAGARVTLHSEVSQTQLTMSDQITLTVTVEADGTSSDPAYTPPELENLEIIRRGTQRGQSFQMNFGSAPRVKLSTTYTYLLQPKKPGKAKIGPATARLGSDLAQSETIHLEVSGKGTPAPLPPQPKSQANIPQPQQGQGRGDPVMLRVVPDKFDAYVGEQVVLSVFLLARVDLSDVQSLTQPQLEGVLLERDDRPRQNLQPKIQRFGGEEYQVFEIARYALFALHDGKVTVGAFQTEAQAGGLFFAQGRSYRVSSPPLELNMKPLPTDKRPQGFSPMNVGQYEFNAQLMGQQGAQVGKPITLRVTISGIGNVSKLTLPAPRLSPKLKTYDPETKSEQKFDQGVLAGRITRDYLFVPAEPGEHLIPPLVFTWFDPKSGTYQEAKSPAYSILAGGEAAEAPQKDATQARVQGDGRALHPIRYASALTDDRPRPAHAWVLWLGGGSGGLAALSIALLRLRRREKTKEEIAREAKGAAQRGIKKATASDDSKVVYAELTRVTRTYLNDRFGISTGVARDALRTALLAEGVADELIDRLLAELDNCDFARFAPGGHLAKEAQNAAERLEQCIVAIEKQALDKPRSAA